jgi:hypothetical protein
MPKINPAALVSLHTLAVKLNRPRTTLHNWAAKTLKRSVTEGQVDFATATDLEALSKKSKRRRAKDGFYEQGGAHLVTIAGTVKLNGPAAALSDLLKLNPKAFVNHCIAQYVDSLRARLS